jgi:uncharacterized protein (TIGR02271 family)
MAERGRARQVVEEEVMPAVAETAVIRKEQVATETVRLHKQVHEEEDALDVPVQVESIAVERVPVDRWVEGPVAVRQEGATTIYPVVKEVVVVEKRLKLVEEVRVTRQQATEHIQQRVKLRREEISVERDDPGS